jgi:hypothetical protein
VPGVHGGHPPSDRRDVDGSKVPLGVRLPPGLPAARTYVDASKGFFVNCSPPIPPASLLSDSASKRSGSRQSSRPRQDVRPIDQSTDIGPARQDQSIGRHLPEIYLREFSACPSIPVRLVPLPVTDFRVAAA